MTLAHTPLHSAHLEAGARMVAFAGWEMPLSYGSQIEEHHQVRRSAGMFDVSHMLAIDVRGAAAEAFLRRVLANDVARLVQPGQALYSCILNEEGGVLDDLIVYSRRDASYRLVVNAGTAGKDLAWLDRMRSGMAVDLVPRRDLAILAVQGPDARSKVWSAWPEAQASTAALRNFEAAEFDDAMVARTGYTGEDGFELMLPADRALPLWRSLVQAGVAPAGLAARDTLRLEAGMNLYGHDMDEHVTPYECGLAWTVDLSADRDFIGREALSNRRAMRKRVGLVLADRGVMRDHQRVRTVAGEGEVTSGGFSPTMSRSVALARVPVDAAMSTEAEVEMRGKWARVRVVEPPFVRRGRVLVRDGAR